MGIFDSSNSRPELVHTEPMPFAAVQLVENVERIQNIGRIVNSPRENVSESREAFPSGRIPKTVAIGARQSDGPSYRLCHADERGNRRQP